MTPSQLNTYSKSLDVNLWRFAPLSLVRFVSGTLKQIVFSILTKYYVLCVILGILDDTKSI